jgi:group I intron endonuclease
VNIFCLENSVFMVDSVLGIFEIKDRTLNVIEGNNDLLKNTGIYKIVCKANSCEYYGSTLQFRERFYSHSRHLNSGIHFNSRLQRAWNKYSETGFSFEILEICSPESRRDLEGRYLFEAGFGTNDKLFNSMPVGDLLTWPKAMREQISSKLKGIKRSEATRLKMSLGQKQAQTPERRERMSEQAKKRTGRKLTPSHRMALHASTKGVSLTPEHKEKIRKANLRRKYIITSPDGEIIEINNLRKFCKDHGLSMFSFGHVLNGRRSHHRGYQCKYADIEASEHKQFQPKRPKRLYTLISPSGEIFETENLNQFCLKNQLDPSSMCKVCKGIYSHHRGWRCSYSEAISISCCIQAPPYLTHKNRPCYLLLKFSRI